MIPLVDVKAQYAPFIPELQERFAEVLESGRFIFGPEVEAFEREAAAYLGVPHAIGVANGTDALVLALEAMGVGRGDEVICPAFTFYATAEAIARRRRDAGVRGHRPGHAQPRSRPTSLPRDHARGRRRSCRCTSSAARRRSPSWRRSGCPLIEDAAQAFGAPGRRDARASAPRSASSRPRTSSRSATAGSSRARDDGGRRARAHAALPRLARQADVRARRRRTRGSTRSRPPRCASSCRISTGWNAARREAAARYAELGLGEVRRAARRRAGPRLPHVRRPHARARAHRGGARRGRDRVAPRTTSTPLHLQPAMRYLGYEPGSLPETERAAAENLALPMWGGIGADAAGAGRRAVRRGRRRRACWSRVVRSPVRSRTGSGRSVADAALVARRLGGSPGCLRFDQAARSTTTATSTGRSSLLVVAIKLAGLRARPASTTAGGATSRRATCGRRSAASSLASRRRRSSSSRSSRCTACSVPRGVWFIDLLLCLAFVAGSRLLARTIDRAAAARPDRARGKEAVIVGAGDAGQLVVKEMQRNPALGYTPIGLVDDDPRKRNLRLHGIRVLGTTDDLPQRHPRPQAGRGADRDPVRLGRACARGSSRRRAAASVPVKTLPGALRARHRATSDLAAPAAARRGRGRSRPRAGRGRPRRRSPSTSTGEVVLVTGAGGSIGSELCRQIARFGPARLVLRRPVRAGAVRDRAGARPRARIPRRPSPVRRRRQGRA